MSRQEILIHPFDNGLTLIVEPMTSVQSAAFSLLVPAGSIFDQPRHNGSAALLTELIVRGAGPLTNEQLSAALDDLGVQRHEHAGTVHVSFTGATLAANLPRALDLYGDILRRPMLPPEQFEPARSGVRQSLEAVEDEPRQKVMIELRRRCYDAPWGLPSDGSLEDLPNLSIDSVRDHYERCFRPNGTILGIAGNVDFREIRDVVGRVFGDWPARSDPTFATGPRAPSPDHIPHESEQTHIGVAYEAVPFRHPDYYAAWAAVSVLSGGMSSRLFTEVRERRGLCYSVYAALRSLKDEARVLCYAGTTNERAQQTLDVTLAELVRLGDSIAEDELARSKAMAKSSLIMQQESTSSRSSSIAGDWYHLRRVRTLDEIRQKIDSLTVENVLAYVHEHPARDFTIVTIGPEALKMPTMG
ncbi:MAG TPA: pitrilysin family protein [Planctomycetaceae bacterium]|nr:pitrilysin family protein [Planctomycetaceae bacterium]